MNQICKGIFNFGLWLKYFYFSVWFFLARLLNLHSTCQDERFGNGNFLEKFVNSCFLSDFLQQKVGLLTKIFRQGCQNCILVTRGAFLVKKVFLDNLWFFLLLFGLWLKIFRSFSKNFSVSRVVKCPFYYSRGSFLRNVCFEKPLSSQTFEDIERYFFEIKAKFFQQGFKNCILRVQENILTKIFLLVHMFIFYFRHWKKNFWSFIRYLRQCCHICTLRVKMNVSGTKYPLEFFWIRVFFRTSSGKTSVVGKNVSAVLSKLPSTCPEGRH